MPKYQVDTLSGPFTFDAEDEDQARRLGKDGGRVVVSVKQLDETDESEFVADVDPEGHSFDSTQPHEATFEGAADAADDDRATVALNQDAAWTPDADAQPHESDYGDEEIVVISRADYDRLVGVARLNDDTFIAPDVLDKHDTDGPDDGAVRSAFDRDRDHSYESGIPARRPATETYETAPTLENPSAAVEVTEHSDDPGSPTPKDERGAMVGEAFSESGGDPYDPSVGERVDSPAQPNADDPYRKSDGDPGPVVEGRNPYDRT